MDGRFLVRVKDPDIMLDDHGWLLFSGRFEGEVSIGLGLNASGNDQLIRLMRVFRVEYMRQMSNRPCWVTLTGGFISLIEPLLPGEGEPFDVAAWRREQQEET